MTMLFVLVCSGALLWGVVNVLQKYYFKDHKVDVGIMVVATMFGAGVSPFVVQLVWLGIPEVSAGFWWPFAGTAFFNIGIQYWGLKALKLEDASVVALLQGTTPIFVILTSWLLLRELPTIFGLVGIGIIVFGTYILALKGLNAEGPAGRRDLKSLGTPWLRLFSSRGARLALFTALLGSISLNFDKMAVASSNPMILSGSVFLTIAIFLYGSLAIRGQWRQLDKSCFWPLFIVGLFLGGANVLMSSGFLYGIVPYVGSLKRTQIVWTTILASIFLGEKYTALRLIAAILVVIGVVFIAF